MFEANNIATDCSPNSKGCQYKSRSTIMDKIFGTNFQFQVKQHTKGKVSYLVFSDFLLVLTKL